MTWLRVSLFLAGLLAGTAGAGGVARYQYLQLEREYKIDHDTLIEIRTDVKWIKAAIIRLQNDLAK